MRSCVTHLLSYLAWGRFRGSFRRASPIGITPKVCSVALQFQLSLRIILCFSLLLSDSSFLLFDQTKPTIYPYTKTPSSYSAVVDLYSCSGQLETAFSLSTCLKDANQTWCRFGYVRLEDAHHIFVECPNYTSLRDLYTQRLRGIIGNILAMHSLPQEDLVFISERVGNLFKDSEKAGCVLPWYSSTHSCASLSHQFCRAHAYCPQLAHTQHPVCGANLGRCLSVHTPVANQLE
jgi:hypothetical protein